VTPTDPSSYFLLATLALAVALPCALLAMAASAYVWWISRGSRMAELSEGMEKVAGSVGRFVEESEQRYLTLRTQVQEELEHALAERRRTSNATGILTRERNRVEAEEETPAPTDRAGVLALVRQRMGG